MNNLIYIQIPDNRHNIIKTNNSSIKIKLIKNSNSSKCRCNNNKHNRHNNSNNRMTIHNSIKSVSLMLH